MQQNDHSTVNITLLLTHRCCSIETFACVQFRPSADLHPAETVLAADESLGRLRQSASFCTAAAQTNSFTLSITVPVHNNSCLGFNDNFSTFMLQYLLSFCQPCFLCRCTNRLELNAGQCRQLGHLGNF